MDSIKVDLSSYRNFWIEFAMRMADHDPSSVLTSDMMLNCLWNWYGIECIIVPGEPIGQVYMSPEMLSAFLLKWS